MRQSSPCRLLALLAAICITHLSALQRPAQSPIPIIIGNDKIELTALANGGAFSRLVLRDGEPLSPFSRIHHFLALDGFGAPSPEEAALGMPFHGESSKQIFKIIGTHEAGPVHSVTLQATLPLAQEVLTRTIELPDGENVVRVTSDLQSLLTVDRPISWAEHATLGPPFMQKGQVVVDIPPPIVVSVLINPEAFPAIWCMAKTLSGPWLLLWTAVRQTSV